jgi:hypothetical protein
VQETLESSRETSAPDAEDLGLEGLEPFIPPETVEAAAPKRVDAPAPASEKVPEWVKTITAGAASAAEAAQAAKTPDATAAARGPEPSLHTGGLEATGTLMGTIERNMPVRAPRPGSVETLATLLQDPTGEAVRQPVPGVALPARETVTRRAGLMQWLVPDGIIYVAVLAALLAVLLINPPFGEQNAPGATDAIAFYNRIEQVASGKPVLIAYDWDAGRTAEMTALSQAVTHHVMMRHLPFVTISTVPQGPGFAQMITDDAKGEFGYQYGRDYLVLGYLPGNEAALRSLTSDFVNALPRDYVNALPAETYGLLQSGKVTSLRDFGLVIDLASDETALRNWVEQISSRTGIPVIAAVPQGLEPLARPYRRVPGAGLDAVLSGQAGAMRYIQQISSQRDQGTTSRFTTARLAESLNAMSVAQIVVALVILAALVNVGTRKILRRS